MSYPKDLGNNRWIIEVKARDGSEDELYLELPPNALDQMGWHEGDVLEWIDRKDGSFELKKKEEADVR